LPFLHRFTGVKAVKGYKFFDFWSKCVGLLFIQSDVKHTLLKVKFILHFMLLYNHKGVLMNHKLITLCRVALVTSLGALMPWIITLGNPVLPVILVTVGILFTWILVRQDQRTLVDERAQLINQKASSMSMYLFLLGTTIVGLVLVTIGNGGYLNFSPMGYILLYSACGLLFSFMISGIYYRRKYGG
jgi:uncharacterized membrane protein